MHDGRGAVERGGGGGGVIVVNWLLKKVDQRENWLEIVAGGVINIEGRR